VIVELEVLEKEMEISEGVKYMFWTFGGTVPGSFIRVRQGDTVEFHLKNAPDSKMPHNIDLHGVTGPGGGAASSFTAPGMRRVSRSRLSTRDSYVYHCATAPSACTSPNGMYGLILIEPPQGLPKVDREYYVMQGDFYTHGKYREKGLQAFSMEKAIDEKATYVLFNGREGALTGDKALQRRPARAVRLYVGKAAAQSRVELSRHRRDLRQGVVRGRAPTSRKRTDHAHSRRRRGDDGIPRRGSGELRARRPQHLPRVQQGRGGDPQSRRSEVASIYSGKESTTMYLGDRALPNLAAVATAARSAKTGMLTLDEQAKAGQALFAGTCSTCHQGNGQGLAGVFPPLAKSDYFARTRRALRTSCCGTLRTVTVNGRAYNSVMPPMSQLTDDEAANIATYVLNSWGNPGGRVTSEQIAKRRKEAAPVPVAAH
jgi:nitrite reductase (NO-forming)